MRAREGTGTDDGHGGGHGDVAVFYSLHYIGPSRDRTAFLRGICGPTQGVRLLNEYALVLARSLPGSSWPVASASS
jgi:hypothetical protein